MSSSWGLSILQVQWLLLALKVILQFHSQTLQNILSSNIFPWWPSDFPLSFSIGSAFRGLFGQLFPTFPTFLFILGVSPLPEENTALLHASTFQMCWIWHSSHLEISTADLFIQYTSLFGYEYNSDLAFRFTLWEYACIFTPDAKMLFHWELLTETFAFLKFYRNGSAFSVFKAAAAGIIM